MNHPYPNLCLAPEQGEETLPIPQPPIKAKEDGSPPSVEERKRDGESKREVGDATAPLLGKRDPKDIGDAARHPKQPRPNHALMIDAAAARRKGENDKEEEAMSDDVNQIGEQTIQVEGRSGVAKRTAEGNPDSKISAPGSLKGESSQQMIAETEILDRKVSVASSKSARTEVPRAPSQPSFVLLKPRRPSVVQGRRHTFPERLMQILDSKEDVESLWWTPDGRAFTIRPVTFGSMVLPKYFEGSKFESFTRKLNRWGFRRATDQESPGTFTFFHPLFRKGEPQLCQRMNGGRKQENAIGNMEQAFQMYRTLPDSGHETLPTPIMLASHSQRLPLSMMPTTRMQGVGGGFPGDPSFGAEVPVELQNILLRQELLRQKAALTQEEVDYKTGLNDLLFRRAEEDQWQQRIRASSQSPIGGMLQSPQLQQSVPPSMFSDLFRRGSGPSSLPSPPTAGFVATRMPNLLHILSPPSRVSAATAVPTAPSLRSVAAPLPPSVNALTGDPHLMHEFAEFLRMKQELQGQQPQLLLPQQQQNQPPQNFGHLVEEELMARQLGRRGRGPPPGPRFP